MQRNVYVFNLELQIVVPSVPSRQHCGIPFHSPTGSLKPEKQTQDLPFGSASTTLTAYKSQPLESQIHVPQSSDGARHVAATGVADSRSTVQRLRPLRRSHWRRRFTVHNPATAPITSQPLASQIHGPQSSDRAHYVAATGVADSRSTIQRLRPLRRSHWRHRFTFHNPAIVYITNLHTL